MHPRLHMLLLYGVAFLTGSISISASSPPLKERISTLKASGLVLKDASTGDVLQQLSETLSRDPHGREISIVLVTPTAALLKSRITANFRETTLKTILDRLCASTGMHYTLDDHAVFIAAKGVNLSKAGVRSGPTRKMEFGETGMRIVLPKLLFAGTECAATVAAIQTTAVKMNATGKPFSLTLREVAVGTKPVHAWLFSLPVGEAIEYICLSTGLQYISPSEGVYLIGRRR